MNGAAAVLDSRISVPKSSITITIDSSHHFLFCARNDQNSLTRLSPWVSAAAFSNSLGASGALLLNTLLNMMTCDSVPERSRWLLSLGAVGSTPSTHQNRV
jgi:hypothetical protein